VFKQSSPKGVSIPSCSLSSSLAALYSDCLERIFQPGRPPCRAAPLLVLGIYSSDLGTAVPGTRSPFGDGREDRGLVTVLSFLIGSFSVTISGSPGIMEHGLPSFPNSFTSFSMSFSSTRRPYAICCFSHSRSKGPILASVRAKRSFRSRSCALRCSWIWVCTHAAHTNPSFVMTALAQRNVFSLYSRRQLLAHGTGDLVITLCPQGCRWWTREPVVHGSDMCGLMYGELRGVRVCSFLADGDNSFSAWLVWDATDDGVRRTLLTHASRDVRASSLIGRADGGVWGRFNTNAIPLSRGDLEAVQDAVAEGTGR